MQTVEQTMTTLDAIGKTNMADMYRDWPVYSIDETATGWKLYLSPDKAFFVRVKPYDYEFTAPC